MSIRFVDLHRAFDGRPVLDGVDLEVTRGEVLFVIGTSGTGKSVLMKHAIGLLKPDRGEVWVDGLRVDSRTERQLYEVRRRCGYVFQHPTLLDALTLAENVALPLRKRRRLSLDEALERARVWLDRVGVARWSDALPGDLGPGVTKRAAVARAMAVEPKYMIYDEPTTGLDPVSARRMDRLIRRLADDVEVTNVVISHDLESIFAIADRVAFLYQGRVRFLDTVEALRETPDPVVRQFLEGAPEGPIPT